MERDERCCLNCGEVFRKKPTMGFPEWENGKNGGKRPSFCTHKCYAEAAKGRSNSWAVGKPSAMSGRKHSEESRAKMSASHTGQRLGEEHPRWTGDSPKYGAAHMWALSHFERPEACEHCGGTNKPKFEWAAKDPPNYTRNREDWLNLCVPCHIAFDGSHVSVRIPKVTEYEYKRAHWRRTRKPKVGECSHCRDVRKTAWANLSGEYRDDDSDWVELCYSCHKRFDLGKITLA